MRDRGQAHALLRAATAVAHERVDRAFARFDLARASGYAAFLAAHASALLPVEDWLEDRAPRVIADWPQRRRGPALVRDLASLGAPVPAGPEFVGPETRAAIAGVLYVVEGSRLGGRVLARSLGAGLPRTYLETDNGAANWSELLAQIEAALDGAPQGQDADAIDAALVVFDRFEVAAYAVPGERAA